jgi:hypothetical protein
LAALAGGTVLWATQARLALRPGQAGFDRVLRGATARGLVSEGAAIHLPGFARSGRGAVGLAFAAASHRPTALHVRIDDGPWMRLDPGAVTLSLPPAPTPTLRIAFRVEGGPVRILWLTARGAGPRARVAALVAGVFALVCAMRRPALGFLGGGAVAVAAVLPGAALAWPVSAGRLGPALVLLAAGLLLLARRGERRSWSDAGIVLALVFGAWVRVVFAASTGSWDTDYWRAWMHRTSQVGVVQAYGPGESFSIVRVRDELAGRKEIFQVEEGGRRFVIDYWPLALVLWQASHRVVAWLAPGLTHLEADSVAAKLPALLGDLLAWPALLLAFAPDRRRALVLAAWYWALPVSWLSSGVLGYLDGVLPPLMVLALHWADRGRPRAAGALLAVAGWIKPTALLVAPALLVALARRGARLRTAVLSGAAVSAAVLLPFVLGGTLVTMLVHCTRLFFQQNLSGGFPNPWWLLSWALGVAAGAPATAATAHVSIDAVSFARAVGVLAFLAGAVLLARVQARGPASAQLAGALLVLWYGMAAVGVHENHPHPLMLLLVATGLRGARLRLLAGLSALVYVGDLLALSGLGRLHGPRLLWLEPLAVAAGHARLALGFDLTVLLAALAVAVTAAAFAWFSSLSRGLSEADQAGSTS